VTTPRLEAPHRRLEAGSRVFETAVVAGYKAFAWVISHVPPAIPRALIARGAQLSYLLWPTKRRWSNANFGHVLGRPPADPAVRRAALGAYATYGTYVVELARLPRLAREHADRLVAGADLDEVHRIWEGSKGGLIFSLGHLGNAEAVAAGVASRGWPINVVADDSTFPGLFEEFRRTREQWGVHVIPWRNLREIYTILRRREMLGLLVDWGYRADGIPVKLFDAWTTLPAGPATLAAKTGSRILPVKIRRNDDRRTFSIVLGTPIEVPSPAPAALQRASQAMADGLADAIRFAPEQWYSFKPIWPADAAEQERLAERAAAMLADDGTARAAGTADTRAAGAAGAVAGTGTAAVASAAESTSPAAGGA
jgi:phosphatidylinositol dimannoside acyltransferase